MRTLKLFQALLVVVACISSPAMAGVKILTPQRGATFSASSGKAQVEISWEDDGKAPDVKDINNFKFLICTGPNDKIHCWQNELASVGSSGVTGNKYNLQVPNTVGTDGAYFIQVYADLKDGHSICYSPRFMLTGMLGTDEATKDDSLPQPPNELQHDSKAFTVPYTEQTGQTRFAPMQLQPGTSVTAKTWTLRFPTSSVSYFSTIDSRLQQLSTITPGWSYTYTHVANSATPAPMPSDNGSWYNPRRKLSSATRKVNFRKAAVSPAPTDSNKRV